MCKVYERAIRIVFFMDNHSMRNEIVADINEERRQKGKIKKDRLREGRIGSRCSLTRSVMKEHKIVFKKTWE